MLRKAQLACRQRRAGVPATQAATAPIRGGGSARNRGERIKGQRGQRESREGQRGQRIGGQVGVESSAGGARAGTKEGEAPSGRAGAWRSQRTQAAQHRLPGCAGAKCPPGSRATCARQQAATTASRMNHRTTWPQRGSRRRVQRCAPPRAAAVQLPSSFRASPGHQRSRWAASPGAPSPAKRGAAVEGGVLRVLRASWHAEHPGARWCQHHTTWARLMASTLPNRPTQTTPGKRACPLTDLAVLHVEGSGCVAAALGQQRHLAAWRREGG